MGLFQLFIIAVGLSMDAFAVAISKGLAMKKISIMKAGIVGLYFGIFQAVMPLIGYFLGSQFQDKITSIDHWIAFVLLGIIGINMIRESRKNENESEIAVDLMANNDTSDSIKEFINIPSIFLITKKYVSGSTAYKYPYTTKLFIV